jgi:hypothetical protein
VQIEVFARKRYFRGPVTSDCNRVNCPLPIVVGLNQPACGELGRALPRVAVLNDLTVSLSSDASDIRTENPLREARAGYCRPGSCKELSTRQHRSSNHQISQT